MDVGNNKYIQENTSKTTDEILLSYYNNQCRILSNFNHDNSNC